MPDSAHGLLLGQDFAEAFDLDVRNKHKLWRVHEGEWHSFLIDEEEQDVEIFGECSGLSEMSNIQREQVDELINSVLAKMGSGGGLTNLIEHDIEMMEHRPIRHKPRRMSPIMQKYAVEELERM